MRTIKEQNWGKDMSTFRLVTPLLRDLDRRGFVALGDEWDSQVRLAIQDLQDRYFQLRDKNRKLIDYSSLPVQMAYAFMYVASHADFLSQILTQSTKVAAGGFLTGRSIRVTSLGGGPGSDLLAIIRLLRDMRPSERPRSLHYRVLDKEPNWHESLAIIADSQRASFEITLQFERIDVTVERDWVDASLADDDYVIMNYFVSEVCALREAGSVRRCFRHLLDSMVAGSSLIYNDSSAYSFYSFFDERIRIAGGFSQIIADSEKLFVSDYDFDDFYKDFMVRFDRNPKQHSSAVFRVLRKQ
jgi:hypothetical protein